MKLEGWGAVKRFLKIVQEPIMWGGGGVNFGNKIHFEIKLPLKLVHIFQQTK